MNRFTHRLGVLVILLTGAFAGGYAQQSGTIKVGGPCTKCSEHILSVVKGIDGVQDAQYDLASNQLSVKYDAGTSLLDISLELSLAGYDAGDFRRDTHAKLPSCCQSATRGDTFADAEDAELFQDIDDEDSNWENPDNLDALDRLSEHKAKSAITDDDLLEEEDDDDDLLNIDEDDDKEDDDDEE